MNLKNVNWDRVAIIVVVAVVVIALSLLVGKAFAADVTVEWTHPTQRVDGAELPGAEIASTELAWGDQQLGTFPNATSVAYPDVSKILQVAPGKWCFRAATKDVDGLQSDWTNPVCVNLKANPNKPVIIRITRSPL